MQVLADDYNASASASLGYSGYLAGILFSVILAVLAASYLVYKRNGPDPVLASAVVLVAIAVFMA